ncbi:MAG: CinA family protein [Gracilibacteraceae bacterium]|jgi:nicotinamide-nucleotide amidase|nr:CinA family protein [Gracilibacteraceae bacterium]
MANIILYTEALAAGLTRRRQTLSTAESCTGGLLGALLTEAPGSSAYYLGGVVTYANELKQNLLGVQAEIIRRRGAVSGEVAREMAAGVRRLTGSDWSLSVTGVAGPAATEFKPAGLVWIGLAGPQLIWAGEFRFEGGRAEVRRQAAEKAIRLLAEKFSPEGKNA